MKKKGILALVLSLCMVLALVPVAALAAEFTDIDDATNASYAGAIERWADEGVITGDGNDAFNPQGDMSRVEGFAIIAKLLNLTKEDDLSAFDDVPTVEWERAAAAKVVAAGIVTGIPTLDENGETVSLSLAPHGELTREQMFVTIAKTLGVNPVEEDAEDFDDIDDAADYAAPYIKALHKMGAVKGNNNEVNPLGIMTREGAALLLDNLIGGYANETGDTVEIGEDGKITLVVADDVTVTGDANDMPIVVSGEAGTVDMKGVEGKPTVNVTVSDVTIKDAPVGTEITASETAENVTANGIDVSADPDKDVVVPEPQPEQSYTPPVHNNEAVAAMNAAWTALNGALDGIGPVSASYSGSTYTLTVDFDKLTSTTEVTDGSGLATAIGKVLKDNFNGISLKVGDYDVYTADGTFDHTGLKNALFTVADGFFHDLGKLGEDNVFRSVPGTATAQDGCKADVTLEVKLAGEKNLGRVKEFAGKLSGYVSMTKIAAGEVEGKYGKINGLTGENEYIVVSLDKLPQSLLDIVKEAAQGKLSGSTAQDLFEGANVGQLLDLLANQEMSGSLEEIETLARMINTNDGLVNTVLGHVSAQVLKDGNWETLISRGAKFDPSQGETETDFGKLVKGVKGVIDQGVYGYKPGDFKVTSATGKYIVPVKVNIDLQSSLGFTADEIVLVELNINLSSISVAG